VNFLQRLVLQGGKKLDDSSRVDPSAIQPPAIHSWDRVRRTLCSWLTVRCVIRTGNLTTSKVAGLILLRIAVDRAGCWCLMST